MPGLVPGIHVLLQLRMCVDGRVKPGHDGGESRLCVLALELALWTEAPEILRGDRFQRIRRDAEPFQRQAGGLRRIRHDIVALEQRDLVRRQLERARRELQEGGLEAGQPERQRHQRRLAIGADADSPSHYAKAKAAGEAAVSAAVPSATIFRPSVMFGPEDQFTNRFAALARMSPVLPLIGGATKMQPVYVGDVATAIADAVDGKAKAGATYELGGPEVLTMREIIEAILAITDRERTLVPLSFGLARLKATFLQFAPGAFKLTPDQVALLERDNVVSDAAKAAGLTLEGLGITPDSLEAIAPQYLWRFRPQGQFQRMGV